MTEAAAAKAAECPVDLSVQRAEHRGCLATLGVGVRRVRTPFPELLPHRQLGGGTLRVLFTDTWEEKTGEGGMRA